jgi:hypothetical protein
MLRIIPHEEFCSEQTKHKDERWGYKVRVPDDFKTAALSANEEWIASKHIATRLLYAKDSEFYEADYPQMWVIGFPHQRQEERGAKIETDGEKTTIEFKNPYKDYKDFIKRESWFVGGGYYFSEEKEDTIGDVKVTKYEIKVEKMVSSPYRIVAYVYHFPDVDFAVQCKVLEDYYKKYDSAFNACLKSLKRIPRTSALPGSVTTGDKILKEDVDESKLTPAELRKRREEVFERTLAREVEALPKGWYVERSKCHVVLSNASRKYAREVLDHADAIRLYLEKTFGDLGSDYVPPGIIRICATNAEAEAYRGTSGSGGWGDWSQQITGSEEQAMGRKDWALEWISSGVTDQFLSFKNRALRQNLPFWLSMGLSQHMKFARSSGRRVEIKPDEYDREYIKSVIKDGKAIPIKQLFLQGDEEAAFTSQCGSVVSYLLTKGNRGKWKDALKNYMTATLEGLRAAEQEFEEFKAKKIAEAEAAAGGGGSVEETENETGESEADADKKWEEFLEALRKREKAIRDHAFQATFGHISDKEWERLDRQWLSYAG